MITYDLDRMNSKGDWVKYCTFTNLDNSEDLIIEVQHPKYAVKYKKYRVTKILTLRSILSFGDIVNPSKKKKEVNDG